MRTFYKKLLILITKNGTFKNIATRRIKDVSDVCSSVLANIRNEEILLNKNFPENLKLANVKPIFKKKDKSFVENYRPVSVLPTVSKIFERIMQKQITDYIGKFISPFLCGYRKGFSTQYALLSLIERWRLCLDKEGFAGALLIDLLKAFDTINHELLIAKLHAYGFSIKALEVLFYKKGGKESRSIQLLVHGLNYFKEFHKDRLLVPCCLIFTSIICFSH